MNRWPMRIVGCLFIVVLFLTMFGMIKVLKSMQATQQTAPAR